VGKIFVPGQKIMLGMQPGEVLIVEITESEIIARISINKGLAGFIEVASYSIKETPFEISLIKKEYVDFDSLTSRVYDTLMKYMDYRNQQLDGTVQKSVQ